VTGYEYGNTRVRAMRSRLLDQDDYAEMMAAGSLDRVLAILAETEYRPDVESALVRTRGLRRLDESTRSNLARTLRAVASFYAEEPGHHVDLLLARWDLRNLRALLRLPDRTRISPDLAGLLVPAGQLDEAALTELATQSDLRSLIDLLVVWDVPSPETAIALARARVRYEAEGDPTVLELALDRSFAEEMNQVLAEEDTGPASILRSEIDVRNLETALRLRSARLDQEPGWSDVPVDYVSGGIVPTEVWAQVTSTDSPEAIAELLTSRRLPTGWDQVVRAWSADDDPVRLREGLQRATTAAAVSRFVTGDVLGFDVPLAFVFAKEAEVRNIRLIARGIAHGIPVDEVEARLEVAA
jgi:V/A-type H+-transporting ATPase subunit C